MVRVLVREILPMWSFRKQMNQIPTGEAVVDAQAS